MINFDNVLVADIETKGLLEDIHTEDDFHVLSIGYKDVSGEWCIKSTNERENVLKVFENPDNVIVGHYFIPYDAAALEKMFNFKIKATIIDSLAISWYLHNTEKKHGLEYWGEKVGIKKLEVAAEEWKDISYEKATARCESDVAINITIWVKFLEHLREIYNTDEEIIKIIRYLNFIMECSREQERQKIQVDIVKVNSTLEYFTGLKEEKFTILQKAMPKVPNIVVKNRPKILYKKDGSMSANHIKWLEFLQSCNLSEEEEGPINYVKSYEISNPNSVKQKKDWLYSLGWVPQTYSYSRDKESGKVSKVEQLLTVDKDLCPSVMKLIDKEPSLESLKGMSVLTHRIGILKGMLKNINEDGFLCQGLYQLANSMRWQHSVVVNFPRVTGKGDISDGKWIRECLIAGEGNKFVQSDLSGIESRTSDHYTFHLNPELIEETSMPYFDPHTKIAVVSNLMSKDEEVWFKWKKENSERVDKGLLGDLSPEIFGEITGDFEFLRNLDAAASKILMGKLKEARSKGKTTNYASLYLVGAETLGRNLSISKIEAQGLIDAYWKIHWAVRVAAESFETKVTQDQMWILCPISKFWHPIRNIKDAFSVVNQSSAVYCFNIWLWNITMQGVWPILQTHDDELLRCKEEDVDKYVKITNEAMRRTNEQLNLNVELACEVQVGFNFAETH